MCKKFTVFPSLRKEDNLAVQALLDELKKAKQIEYVFVGGATHLLNESVDLPSVLTDEGDRLDGLEAITRFLKNQLKRELTPA